MKKVNPFKKLQTIHRAMLIGMVLFSMVAATVHLHRRTPVDPSTNKVLQIVALALAFIFIRTGIGIFNRRLRLVNRADDVFSKLAVYRIAIIIKWASIEIPVLCAIVGFMITRNYAFVVLAYGLMIYFALQGPLKERVMGDLNLSEQDMQKLEGPLP